MMRLPQIVALFVVLVNSQARASSHGENQMATASLHDDPNSFHHPSLPYESTIIQPVENEAPEKQTGWASWFTKCNDPRDSEQEKARRAMQQNVTTATSNTTNTSAISGNETSLVAVTSALSWLWTFDEPAVKTPTTPSDVEDKLGGRHGSGVRGARRRRQTSLARHLES